MGYKTIKKSIDINASKDSVWKVLIDDQYTRQWYNEFSPGSYAETDWKVGSTAKFFDEKEDGIIARVVTNKPNEELSMTFIGMADKGKEIYDGDVVQGFKDTFETYKLSENNGVTKLDIASDMNDEYYEHMQSRWDVALEKVKALAENN